MDKVKMCEGLRRAVITVTVALIMFVWPVHPFRQVASVRSGDEGHGVTEPLAAGESITQYFRAPDNNIIQLEFVLTREEDGAQDGELLFEFVDPDGAVIYEETYQYGDIPDYGYGGPVLNLKLKKGAVYAYRLTNLNITDNLPCGVYTSDAGMACLKRSRLEAAGQQIEGELLTRLTTNSPLTPENTVAVWGCIGMVGFAVYELLGKVRHQA